MENNLETLVEGKYFRAARNNKYEENSHIAIYLKHNNKEVLVKYYIWDTTNELLNTIEADSPFAPEYLPVDDAYAYASEYYNTCEFARDVIYDNYEDNYEAEFCF